MSERPRLIAQLDAMHQSRGGDWFYRTFSPGRAMAERENVYVVNLDLAHRRLTQILERADVLVMNGVCSADMLTAIQDRKRQGRVSVFEINDDVQAIQPSNPLAGFFAQAENLRLFRRLALTADAVQYSVPELERVYGSLNGRGRVFRNQIVSVPPLAPRSASDVRIGWGGSAGHLEDMAEVAPTLIDLVQRDPRLTLALMCSDRIWQLFSALPDSRKHRTPVGTIEQYYEFVSSLDIGIAPNRDKGFNRARSDVKFLEFAACGAVAVVQRLTPYLESVRDGITGCFFDDAASLGDVLSRLAADPAERQKLRENAHGYVSRERLQAQHVDERLRFYAELQPQPPSDSAPGALFAELCELEGAETHGRHVVLGHGRYETLLHDGLVALQSGTARQQGTDMLRRAAELEPTLGMPELVLGAQLGSEPALRAAMSKNPRSVQAALALGQCLLERGQLKPALERFLVAAELAPGYEMPFVHAALLMQKLGAAREAAEFARLAESLAAPVER
jgi:hypothetical protein